MRLFPVEPPHKKHSWLSICAICGENWPCPEAPK